MLLAPDMFYAIDSAKVRYWGVGRFCDMLRHYFTRKALDPTDIETP